MGVSQSHGLDKNLDTAPLSTAGNMPNGGQPIADVRERMTAFAEFKGGKLHTSKDDPCPDAMIPCGDSQIHIAVDPVCGYKSLHPRGVATVGINISDDFYFSVSPTAIPAKLYAVLGMGDPETGDSRFDGNYYLRTNSQATLLSLLTPPIRAKLDTFSGLCTLTRTAQYDTEIASNRSHTLRLIIDRELLSVAELAQFHELVEMLVERLRELGKIST